MRAAFRALLLAFACAGRARAKITTDSARLTGEFTEHEISKFAFSVGKNPLEVTVWLDEGAEYASDELRVYGYLDDNWDEVTKATTCEEKVKLARWTAPVVLRDGAGEAGGTWAPPKGSKRWVHTRTISSSIRTHVWYFMLADCSLERYLHRVPLVHYRVMMKDGTSHLPIDEAGLKSLHAANAAAAAGLAVYLAGRAVRTFTGAAKKGGGATVHAAEVGLFLAAFADAASSWCELAHLLAYERNGTGSYFFDAWSAYAEAVCDALLALMALCIAAGWTLSSHLGDDEKIGRNPLRTETFPEKAASAAAPLAAALRAPLRQRGPAAVGALGFIGFHVALAQWSRMYDDDFDSFHDFEHPPGRIVVWLRVLLACLFVPIALRTQGCAGARLRRFYVGWAFVGTVWLLSLPLVTWFASLFAPYLRHRLVQIVTAVVQTAALAGFAALFTGRAAKTFHESSTVGDGAANLDFAPRGRAAGPKLRVAGVKVNID